MSAGVAVSSTVPVGVREAVRDGVTEDVGVPFEAAALQGVARISTAATSSSSHPPLARRTIATPAGAASGFFQLSGMFPGNSRLPGEAAAPAV